MGFLFARKQTISNTEERIGALRIQASNQGEPIPIVYGKTRVTGNLVWYGDFTAIPTTETQTSGGKGGGGGVTTETTTYTYTVAMIMGLAEGPIEGIGTIWSNKDIASSEILNMTEFDGDYPQLPWDFMSSNHPDEALGYQGTAYVANAAFDLGSNSGLPNLSFEVKGFLFTDSCSPDVNPADIILDILTSENYGAGFPSGSIASLSNFRLYCNASNFQVSPAYKAQIPAAQVIAELCIAGNSAPVWSEGLLKIIPYGDSQVSYTKSVQYETEGMCVPGPTYVYNPNTDVQYSLGYGDFLASPGQSPVKIRRKRPADAFNVVQIQCLDRANDYNPAVVERKDQAAIEMYGLRPAPMYNLPMICDLDIAGNIAQTLLQRLLYIRNEYEFTLGWKYARLEPMDLVELYEPNLGLDYTIVRITKIREDENGELSITAEEFIEGIATPGIYPNQGSSGYVVNQNENPGDTNEPVIFQPTVELSGVPQIWIGASGGPTWGGCQIWVSTDGGGTYGMIGELRNAARYGELTSDFPSHVNPDTTNTLSVDLTISRGTLTNASEAQADARDTLSWVGGELIAYSAVELTAPYNYDLTSYIRRGLLCTLPSDHPIGTKFMRLDGAVGKFNVSGAWVGVTLMIKLLSFNNVGGGLQSIESVSPFEYEVEPLGITAVNGTIPNVIEEWQALCIQPNTQYSVLGRMTLRGRINCDGKLIIN